MALPPLQPEHRDVEDLLAARGVTVNYEAIRLWCNKFGSIYAQRLRREHHGYGDTFSLMKSSSRSMESNIIFGQLLTRMVKLSMSFYKNDVTERPQSVSLNGYFAITKVSHVSL